MERKGNKKNLKNSKQNHQGSKIDKKEDQFSQEEADFKDQKDKQLANKDSDANCLKQQTPQKPIRFTLESIKALQKTRPPMPDPIAVFKNIAVYEYDLKRLSSNGWLNDVLIDFHIEFLRELMSTKLQQKQDAMILHNNLNSQESCSSKILCEFAFQSIDQQQYNESVCDLIRPRQYFRIESRDDQNDKKTQVSSILERYQRIYVVVNESNYHWILVELSLHEDDKSTMSLQEEKRFVSGSDLIKDKYAGMYQNISKNLEEQKTIEQLDQSHQQQKKERTIRIRVFDSLGKRSQSTTESRTCVKLLKQYLSADFQDLYEEKLNFQVTSEIAPTQAGGPQCGVFVCFYLQLLFFNQQFLKNSEHKRNFSLSDVRFSNSQVAEYREFMIQNIMSISSQKANTKEYGNVYEQALKHKMMQLETYL